MMERQPQLGYLDSFDCQIIAVKRSIETFASRNYVN